ncbi:MAG: Adenine specific DNA methylase Mod (type III restriction-modification system) [Ignavibacteria bacterium]|nr:MAG: Adenine specific DNA methylase Mod (type III restriction-modification system) [Ignavibacteria bacterium]KAF0155155.1 MAG: Adenine specific DNA methylase Mod (type III restriction-modification system) [Ignavibacteria bacterium]
MAKKSSSSKQNKRPIEQYEHKDKERPNNPPVGLVTPETDQREEKKTYQYDPHLDPQLVWAGKAEHTSFEVPTVSLHVHERIDPRSIIEAVRKKNGNNYEQMSLFSSKDENPPLRDAVEFYKHRHNWSNRLIAGDSLLVMNSLIEKEGLAGQVQMVYFDPPYGIKYGSNFQPFINKRDVKDGKDEDLSQEPEMIKAFRDTWELGVHSYLTYLRDRLLLARELLNESGSVFVQIGDENLHHVREILDEVFGHNNFFSLITFKKTLPLGSSGLAGISDFLIWYAKDIKKIKYHELYEDKPIGEGTGYTWIELEDGSRRKMTSEEKNNVRLVPQNSKIFFTSALASSGYTSTCMFDFEFDGTIYKCGSKSWRTNVDGMNRLIKKNRIVAPGKLPCFVQFIDDFPVQPLHNLWNDTHGASDISYVVQTSNKVIQRCILMTTDPGDLVYDPTCGSGTTAYVAEEWGRRWITCDTSRVAITLCKQRLMTSIFDYYHLSYPEQGVGSGFLYRTVPHITLKTIANDEPPVQETLYDQPFIDNSRTRVTGPFTVEAVPSPVVKPIGEILEEDKVNKEVDNSIARKGETLRQSEWRDELLRTGIRGKRNQYIYFSRVEPIPGTRYLHADAETKVEAKKKNLFESENQMSFEDVAQRAVVSFGPEHAPLEQRQVALAIEEAQKLIPKPKLIIFAAFQFDPEAAKDIDETEWPGVSLLKVQMNTDLLTDDLKKKRSSNESYWLIGQPEIKLSKVKGKKDESQKYTIEVKGFDYFNTKTGHLESGSNDRIAVWMLDTDYDGRSLFPRQVFFPMAGEKEGWTKLAKNLKAEIDEELIEAFKGTISLPFEAGKYNRVAVKIVDDRGIESLKVMELS